MLIFDPNPKLRWLICATHPDDEVAIIGWVSALVQARAEVFLSYSHDTPIREAEARAATSRVGIPPDRLYFLHGTDQHIVDEIGELLPKFEALRRAIQPDRVMCGAFEQGHIDHDATNFMVSRTFEGTPVLEFPLYHPYTRRAVTVNRFADSIGEEIRPTTAEEGRLKLAYARSFPSQRIWSLLVLNELRGYLTLRPARLARFERLRLQKHTDYLTPNLPERLSREVEASAIWKRWVKAIQPWIDHS